MRNLNDCGQHPAITDPLLEVKAERARQDKKWGEQNHPDGTGGVSEQFYLECSRGAYEHAKKRGSLTWLHVLEEEVMEAFCETDPAKLREELIQVAAVAVAWIECIDRRAKDAASE